jgi:cytochrome oxidase Cu insertion factor (SCO1/SenC/PrrC family)
MTTTQDKRPSRTQLILLAVLFLAPLMFAFATYYGSNWRPLGHTNHGDLIEPAMPLPELPALATPVAPHLFKGKWSLVYIGDGQCDDACRQTLFFMQQTQQSLGALIPRTQRVWLAGDHCCSANVDKTVQPPLIQVDAQGDGAHAWLAAFPADPHRTTIFIVDPRGNLMMRYDSTADPKGLREDLKKLLGLSHIG